MFKFTKMAWRNIWRNWRRTAIALIAIVLGLILIIIWDGFLQGFDQAIHGNSVRLYGGNIQVHAPGFRDRASRLPLIPLDNADEVVQAVQGTPEVVAVARRINTGGLISSPEGSYPVIISGIEPEVEAPINLMAENIDQGRFLNSEDGDAIVIGQAMADLLGVTVGDRVTLMGRRLDESMRQSTMTVAGIYDLGTKEAEKITVLIALPTAQTLYNLRGQETEVAISLQSVGQENTLIPDLQADLPQYEVDSWVTLRPEIQEMMALENAFLGIFGLIVLLIASIGILNLMLMAVFERTREMGVLQALGMKGRQLMGLFVMEGMMIGAVGAVVGCILGWLLILLLAQVGIDMSSYGEGYGEFTALMGERIFPSASLISIVGYGIGVVFIAGLASLLPARQASRNEPAEALHHV
ncbi:MAG: ABC transporter permease [Chloroflexota bacterium]|nr:MAG: ABC transporter permease [Chloroflexota bacterium]